MAEGEVTVTFKSKDELSGGAKRASSALDKVKRNWVAVTAAVGGALIAMGKVWDMTAEGANLMRLSGAADRMAAQFGQSMDRIAESMSKASNETVDRMTLMGAASRAMQLGVAKTPEEFEKLTKASIALGQAMGRGPAEAIDDIVTGVGRMSPLILDNIGVMTRGGAVFDDYAKSVGKTAEQLTDAEKKQALLNAAMESAKPLLDENGNVIADIATGYDQMAANTKNVTDNLKMQGAVIAGPVVQNSADWHGRLMDLDDAYRALNAAGIDFQGKSDEWVIQTGKIAAQTADLGLEVWQTARFVKDDLIGALNAIPENLKTTHDTRLTVNGDVTDVDTWFSLMAQIGGTSGQRNRRQIDIATGGIVMPTASGAGPTTPIDINPVLRGIQP